MEKCLKLKIFGAFQPVLGALKLVCKYWKLAIFPTDALLLVYFLHRKNLSAIVLSPALTFYWKMRKNIFQSFLSIFRGLENIWGNTEKQPIFSRCSISDILSWCMFSAEKKLRCYYFIFSPKNLSENPKMSQNNISQSFSSIFWLLATIWRILKNHQVFSSCPTACIFSTWKGS